MSSEDVYINHEAYEDDGDETLEQDNLETSNGDEDDEDYVLPSEVLKKLTQVWTNELLSPALLPHQFELVDCMVEQVEEMNKNISRLSEGEKKELRCAVHKMELLRISYIINSYLR